MGEGKQMIASIVLGCPEEPAQLPLGQLESKISLTQDPIRDAEKRVEVHEFNVPVSIPTVGFRTSYFLYSLMGHDHDSMLVSPTGCWAKEFYGKPVSKLRVDTGENGSFIGHEGPNQLKSTNEDTRRYWVLNNSEFIKELVQSGWHHFPTIEQVAEYDSKQFGLKSEHLFKRSFSLADLIKVIEISDNDGNDYSSVLGDLRELTPFGDKMEFVYEGGSSGFNSFFHLPVKYKENHFGLILDDLSSTIGIAPKDRQIQGEPINTMRRNIRLNLNFQYLSSGDSPTWDARRKSRISQFTREYAGAEKINCGINYLDEEPGLSIVTSNRKYGDNVVKPDTNAVLENAIKLQNFVGKCVGVECKNYSARQLKDMEERRRELNLPAVPSQMGQ